MPRNPDFARKGKAAPDHKLIGTFLKEGIGVTDPKEAAAAELLITKWLGWLNS